MSVDGHSMWFLVFLLLGWLVNECDLQGFFYYVFLVLQEWGYNRMQCINWHCMTIVPLIKDVYYFLCIT